MKLGNDLESINIRDGDLKRENRVHTKAVQQLQCGTYCFDNCMPQRVTVGFTLALEGTNSLLESCRASNFPKLDQKKLTAL